MVNLSSYISIICNPMGNSIQTLSPCHSGSLSPEKPAPKAAVKPSKAFDKKKKEEEPPVTPIAKPTYDLQNKR